jgi:cysteine desulfurase
MQSLPDSVIHGKLLPRLPNTSLISFPTAFSDEIVSRLDALGVCASGGAACDSGKREPSRVMQAMQQPLEVGLGAVRFSLSRFTTAADIATASATIVRVVSEVSHPTALER